MSTATREDLRAFLSRAEIDPARLARDPAGRTWLPAELAALAQSEPAAGQDLARFVAAERAMFAEAELAPDPYFVRRVVSRLPCAAPSPAARIGVLALFHALGAVAVYLTAWIVAPADVDGWFDAAHGALDQTLAAPGALWPAQLGPLAVTLTLVAAAFGLLATRLRAAHTRRA